MPALPSPARRTRVPPRAPADQVVEVELVALPVAAGAARPLLGPRLLERLGHLPALAVAVVLVALLGVAQHLVGAVDLLEALLGALIARIYVRMMLARQFAVGLLDLFLRSAPFESKHIVIVSCHQFLVSKILRGGVGKVKRPHS